MSTHSCAKALGVNAEYVPALLNAGIIHAKAKRYSDAEGAFLDALRIEPSNRKVLYNTAILYEIEGNFGKAKEFYTRLQAYGDKEGTLGIKRLISHQP